MHRSVWATDTRVAGAPLEGALRTEVCVIGAGFAGTNVAYRLARAGRSVVLLDDGDLPGGESTRTSAHLVDALDRGYATLETVHGAERAAHAAESHGAAIDTIEETVAREGIDCAFERVDGFLCGDADRLDLEFAAARRAGLPVERCTPPLLSLACGACLRFPRQAQFDPVRYLTQLLQVVQRNGVRVFPRTHATRIDGSKRARVLTAGGAVVIADAVVVATNTPINYIVSLHTKQAAYRTYMIAARVPCGSIPVALYWDMDDPFHYVRLVRGTNATGDLLLVGGEDHKTGQGLDTAGGAHGRLEAWARARFHRLGAVEYRWSGQIMESVDGLAFIGRTERRPNVFVVTGDSGNGLTHGAIASLLLTDLIQGRSNTWDELYDPGRLRWRALPGYARENANVVVQLGDWIRPAAVRDADAIPHGTGAVVQRGLARVAIYRDPGGDFHERSAVCPHLRCVVRWNGVESTWDCPCHGSRFDPYGVVVNGPANRDLAPVEPVAPARPRKRPTAPPFGRARGAGLGTQHPRRPGKAAGT